MLLSKHIVAPLPFVPAAVCEPVSENARNARKSDSSRNYNK